MTAKAAEENAANNTTDSGLGKYGAGAGAGGKLSFDAIRESLRQLRLTNDSAQNERRSGDPMSLSAFKNSLKLKPGPDSAPVFGGTESLPVSVFGKERERKEGEKETMAMKTEFVKMYSYGELGEKLRKLRPSVQEGKKGGDALGFSLSELNERLMKLREMEEKETESRIGGVSFKDLRESLVWLRLTETEKAKKNSSKFTGFRLNFGELLVLLKYVLLIWMVDDRRMYFLFWLLTGHFEYLVCNSWRLDLSIKNNDKLLIKYYSSLIHSLEN